MWMDSRFSSHMDKIDINPQKDGPIEGHEDGFILG